MTFEKIIVTEELVRKFVEKTSLIDITQYEIAFEIHSSFINLVATRIDKTVRVVSDTITFGPTEFWGPLFEAIPKNPEIKNKEWRHFLMEELGEEYLEPYERYMNEILAQRARKLRKKKEELQEKEKELEDDRIYLKDELEFYRKKQ